jgi:hypothetical protein
MRYVAAITTIVFLVVLGPTTRSPAQPRKRGPWVTGKVVQLTIAGVYVNLGSRFGLRVGDEVQVRMPDHSWATQKISAVGARHAFVKVAPDSLPPRGSPARARWRTVAPVKPEPTPGVALDPPEPLDRLAARWKGVDRARPELVEYHAPPRARSPRGRGGLRGALRLEYLGLLNLASDEPRHYNQLGLSSTLEVPRLLADWLDYAHHLRVRFHLARDLDARPFSRSRPELLVHRLRLGLHLDRVHGQIGRLVGGPLPDASVVDGASVRAKLTPSLHVGAFGGLLPRSDDLRPDVDGAHFGAYAALRLDGQSGWTAAADAGILGSTWQGELDRRALSARAALDGPRLSLAAHAVVDLYGSDHPRRSSGAALSQLSVLAEGKAAGWLHLGARFDRYLFVPSLESLATYPDYIDGRATSSARGHADVQLGARTTLGVQGGWDRQDSRDEAPESWTAWGELMLRLRGLLGGDEQLRLAALTYHGALLAGHGGRLVYLQPLSDWLSLSLDYALHRDRYAGIDGSAVWRHDAALGGEATYGRWLLTTEARLVTSDEERLLQLLAVLAFQL